MNIIKDQQAEKLTIALEGRLDTTTSPQLEGDLRSSVNGITELVFDLEKLDYISSAGLRVLLAAQKVMNRQGEMKIKNVKPEIMEKGHFVPGRSAMTCCAEDIAFLGFICKTPEADKYKKGDWVTVTAKIKMEYWKDYNGVGPVLYATEVVPAKAPKEEVISLV